MTDAGDPVMTDAGTPDPTDAGGPPPPPSDAGGPPPIPDAGRDAGRDAGGPACSESPCRLVSPQCGCGAGLGCDIEDSTVGRICTPTGPTPEGASCDLFLCQAGLDCVRGSATLNWCERYCATDADCIGGPGSLCLETLADPTGAALTTACTMSCNPVTSAGCISGAGCQILFETAGAMRALTHCIAAGSGGQGAVCTDSSGCQAGYGCLDSSAGGTGTTCHRWCRPGGTSTCPGTTTCTGFVTPVTIGGTTYGVCV